LLTASALGTSQAQTADEASRAEVFKDPHPAHLNAPDCNARDSAASRITPMGDDACQELLRGTGGWVRLGFMVDAKGKPFEIAVVDSTGNKTFERIAAQSLGTSTFTPGSLNGKPIESAFEMVYRFEGNGGGATTAFRDAYAALRQAITNGDQAAADTAMAHLKITNLYEDAFTGLCSYLYAKKWGDETQQLAGLRRALVGDYLGPDQMRSALLTRITLELNMKQYSEGVTTWKRLQKLGGIDSGDRAYLQATIDQLEKSRLDGSSYDISGQMQDGSWFLHLFKRHFRAAVSEGSIVEVKLRCQKQHLSFAFDPKMSYEIGDQDGDCSIQLIGAPGTRFKLTQF
jgi:hypothetical protein